MKNRSYLETTIRNIKLISDEELANLWCTVDDEVKRRSVSSDKFRDKYFDQFWFDLRKIRGKR